MSTKNKASGTGIDLSNINVDFWVLQIQYWRTHLDVFIVDMMGIDLKPIQRVMARAIGNGVEIDIVQSRGFGKTFLVAMCTTAMAILYPGSGIGVVSKTASQATLVLQKIQQFLEPRAFISREIKKTKQGLGVRISGDFARVDFHGGSFIESRSMNSILGRRYKIVVGDEKPQIPQAEFNKNVTPTRAETRAVCFTAGIEDYKSKLINITSSCRKNNYFFADFMRTFNKFGEGHTTHFAVATDYLACIENGIHSPSYFEGERERLPSAVFAMEYESLFLGEEMGSIFPFNLTDSCRTLREVEYAAPRNSTSDYVIGVDLATSSAGDSDNAAMVVLKLAPKPDGTIIRKLVYLRTYNGRRFDVLSNELRKLLVRFPRTTKVVFDMNGVGQPFPEFMSQSWTDPMTGREYPPLILDDTRAGASMPNAQPILRGVIANNLLNQKMVNDLRVVLEKKTIEFPIESARVRSSSGGDDSGADGDSVAEGVDRKLTMQEEAIYIETDALQIEMGNIISRETEFGNTVFTTSERREHKDRYSALALANTYVTEIEDEAKRRYLYSDRNAVVGLTFSF